MAEEELKESRMDLAEKFFLSFFFSTFSLVSTVG